MKILILGLPRSGTTSLIKGIADQGYKAIIEPFNNGLQNARELEYPLKDLSYDDVVVKNTTYQKPYTWSKDWHEFNLEFMPNFNKFIFLDRKHFGEHYESIVHLWYRVFTDSTTMQAWADEDIPLDFKNGYRAAGGADKLHKEKESLRELLHKVGQQGNITYYEDLYGADRYKSLEIIKQWELEGINAKRLNEFLHPSKKLYRGLKRASI